MADRTNKNTGIKVISQVGRDPEAGRFKRVQEEEMKLRAALRTDSKVTFNIQLHLKTLLQWVSKHRTSKYRNHSISRQVEFQLQCCGVLQISITQ
jgi:hypothetical protein